MEYWIGKITGVATVDAWVQVHDFTPVEETQLAARGRLVAIVGFQNAPDQEVSAQGREILSRLNELYYGGLELAPIEQLKHSVKTIQLEFDNEQQSLQCICLALLPDVVYVARTAGGVWAQIGDKEGWLIPAVTPPETVCVSGSLRPGLNIVAGNSQFWQAMSLGVVKAALKNGEHDQVLETLGSVIHGNSKLTNAAGAVIEVSQEAVEVPVVALVAKPKFKLEIKLPNWLKKGPNIYINNEAKAPKRRRTLIMGLGFLVILLLLVTGWQIRKKQLIERSSVQNAAIEDLLYTYREASGVSQLNPIRSRQLVQEVQNGLDKLPVNKNTKADPRLAEIRTGLPQVLGVATGSKFPETNLVFDLALVRQDLSGSVMRQLDSNLVVLDNNSQRLVIIDPAKKKGNVVAGQDALGMTKTLATYPSKIEIISDKGVVECQMTNVKCQIAIQPDEQMNGAIDVAMYGGNIYLLNMQSIWRYQAATTGFSLVQKWLTETETADFSTSQSMTIDGNIWIAKSNGVIEKYVRGVKDNFNIQDLDAPFGGKIALYTDENSTKLYVLDTSNSRIVAITKDTGEFDSQYKAEQLKDTNSFVIDEQAGIIYLLAGSKIWGAKL